ncbi:MAG: hypothetical protein R8M45_01955 [Ghiorsea sp.]
MSEDASVIERAMKTYVMGAEFGAVQAIEALCHCFKLNVSEEQFSKMILLISEKADVEIRSSLMKAECATATEDMQVH